MEAILLQVILIGLNAVFASAEIAVISMNDTKLERMARDGDARAKRLAALTAQPTKFLSTIQVAITLAGLLGSAFAAENFAGTLVQVIQKTGIDASERILKSFSVFLITLVVACLWGAGAKTSCDEKGRMSGIRHERHADRCFPSVCTAGGSSYDFYQRCAEALWN
mgnify:CR=1 FL=1